MRKLGDTITYDFTTHNSATGAVSDADSTPTCEVFENTTDVPILTPTVTKRNLKTGNYRASVAATVGNGFAVGRSYSVVVSATVGSVAAKACIASFSLESKRMGDLNDLAAGAAMTLTAAYDAAKTAAQASDIPTTAQIKAAIEAAGSHLALIKAKTDNLPTDPADQSAVEAAITAAVATLLAAIGSGGLTQEEVAEAVWDAAVAAHTAAGTFGEKLGSVGSIIFEAS